MLAFVIEMANKLPSLSLLSFFGRIHSSFSSCRPCRLTCFRPEGLQQNLLRIADSKNTKNIRTCGKAKGGGIRKSWNKMQQVQVLLDI